MEITAKHSEGKKSVTFSKDVQIYSIPTEKEFLPPVLLSLLEENNYIDTSNSNYNNFKNKHNLSDRWSIARNYRDETIMPAPPAFTEQSILMEIGQELIEQHSVSSERKTNKKKCTSERKCRSAPRMPARQISTDIENVEKNNISGRNFSVAPRKPLRQVSSEPSESILSNELFPTSTQSIATVQQCSIDMQEPLPVAQQCSIDIQAWIMAGERRQLQTEQVAPY